VVAWYFFDTRDDGITLADEVGLEVADFESVKELAAKGLAELAVDVLPQSTERCLGVDVRDQQSRPVLTSELTFQARVIWPVD
jgi:hypothetical protein